jgi:hypothetical protein
LFCRSNKTKKIVLFQIAYDGSPDSALVAYATLHEAETAYKNPQPLFNNRFIKIFWHNTNKVSFIPKNKA